MKDKVKNEHTIPADPPWAEGLKRIYSSVLEEPLPDMFERLLDKLDKAEPDDRKK